MDVRQEIKDNVKTGVQRIVDGVRPEYENVVKDRLKVDDIVSKAKELASSAVIAKESAIIAKTNLVGFGDSVKDRDQKFNYSFTYVGQKVKRFIIACKLLIHDLENVFEVKQLSSFWVCFKSKEAIEWKSAEFDLRLIMHIMEIEDELILEVSQDAVKEKIIFMTIGGNGDNLFIRGVKLSRETYNVGRCRLEEKQTFSKQMLKEVASNDIDGQFVASVFEVINKEDVSAMGLNDVRWVIRYEGQRYERFVKAAKLILTDFNLTYIAEGGSDFIMSEKRWSTIDSDLWVLASCLLEGEVFSATAYDKHDGSVIEERVYSNEEKTTDVTYSEPAFYKFKDSYLWVKYTLATTPFKYAEMVKRDFIVDGIFDEEALPIYKYVINHYAPDDKKASWMSLIGGTKGSEKVINEVLPAVIYENDAEDIATQDASINKAVSESRYFTLKSLVMASISNYRVVLNVYNKDLSWKSYNNIDMNYLQKCVEEGDPRMGLIVDTWEFKVHRDECIMHISVKE